MVFVVWGHVFVSVSVSVLYLFFVFVFCFCFLFLFFVFVFCFRFLFSFFVFVFCFRFLFLFFCFFFVLSAWVDLARAVGDGMRYADGNGDGWGEMGWIWVERRRFGGRLIVSEGREGGCWLFLGERIEKGV